MDFFKTAPLVRGVFHLTEPTGDFSSKYLKIRQLENRIYDDQEVAALPFAASRPAQIEEWKQRAATCRRAERYFFQKQPRLTLEIGCGNGWFSARLASVLEGKIVGLDVNLPELEQAARVFQKPNLQFAYADIFAADFQKTQFDCIVLNASAQYFERLPNLLRRLFELLTPEGEIHFFDTPFYSKTEAEKARQRTINYYKSMSYEEMAAHYFHRTWDELDGFRWQILHRPHPVFSKLRQLVGRPDSPFVWLKIQKS